MLANDPHLGLGLPAVWYQMSLRAPGFEVSGMSLPGAPGIVIGRGPVVAWAFTNTMLDDHDLFLEEVDESTGTYRRGEVWVPLEVETQEITVRGGEVHQLVLRSTDRGPLLEAKEERGLPARSLAWTAYQGGDPLGALRRLSQATTPEEAIEGIGSYICPAQNLVAAFASGEILFTVLGRIPDRLQGDGLLPSPGWDQSYGWRGLRPRQSNPTIVDPEEGYLATTNSDNRPIDYPLAISANYDTDHRRRRIAQSLEERTDWTVEALADLQMDLYSLYAQDVLAALGNEYQGEAGQAMTTLRAWDGRMDMRGPSALYALLERNLTRGVFTDEAAAVGLGSISSRGRLLRVLSGSGGRDWWDDVSTPEVESREQISRQALAAAWRETQERWGEDSASWNYGALHTLTLQHPLEGVPLLGTWLRRGPFEMPGSASTVAAFGAHWRGDALDVTYGPSMRWIVDWSQPDRAFAALPGGQSGHPMDAHYDDRIGPYLAGELQESFWSEEGIAASAVSRMQLLPAGD
jgi:penicillin amidase